LNSLKRDFFERTEEERIYMTGKNEAKYELNDDYDSSKIKNEKKFNIFNAEEDEENEFKLYERKIINNFIPKSGKNFNFFFIFKIKLLIRKNRQNEK
jgi:hypothetical protein